MLKMSRKQSLNPQKHVLDDLNTQIESALEAIRQHAKKNQPNTPWILLLGPNGSGKTSLLAHAETSLISPQRKSIQDAPPTKNIDWWVADNAIYIDPAGKYCFSHADQPQDQTREYWHAFLQTLAKQRRPLFDNICLVIDLSRLIYPNDTAFEELVVRIEEQLHTLAPLCSPMHLNIIITQCDYLAGFAEFFSHISPTHRNQPLGFSLIENESVTHLNERFTDKFKQFIGMINSRLLDRLYREPNLERRRRINEFPIQLEKLQEPLSKFVNAIPSSAQVLLENVFFCASSQTANTINLLDGHFAKAFNIKMAHCKPLVNDRKAAFIPQMLEIIAKSPQKTSNSARQKKWWHTLVYPLTLVAILIGVITFHQSYRENLTALQSLREKFSHIHSSDPWIEQLNSLYSAKRQLDQYAIYNDSIFSFNDASLLRKQVNLTYQKFIRSTFVNFLNQSLSDKIKQDIQDNSPALYNSTQAYLMFSNRSHMQKSFILQWFQKFWAQTLAKNEPTQKQLLIYLQDTLALPAIYWKTDHHIIQQAQTTLQQQPLAQIVFKMLINQSDMSATPLSDQQDIAGINLKSASLAKFYSSRSFADIYNHQIPALAQSITNGNWVIGKTSADIDTDDLVKQLRSLYVKEYLQQSKDAFSKITFDSPQSLQDLVSQIHLLSNPQSPLWQFYQNIIHAPRTQDQSTIANASNDSFLPDQNKMKPMLDALQLMEQYLTTINSAPSPIKASYDQAVRRYQNNGINDPISNLQHIATDLPEPFKAWTHAIAQNAWKLILANTKTYLNTLWQTNVIPGYTASIKDRYPIFSDAKQDADVTAFNHFFGPGGAIQNYFNNYLKPFVDMSQVYWTWKKLDDLQLDSQQSFLDMIIRASMIQKMFYADNAQIPTLHFKLTPVDMSTTANQFILNVGGQMIRYLPGLKRSSNLNWPGPDGNFVTMRFDDASNNHPTTTAMGPWAWLRILQGAKVQASSDPSVFELSFTLDNDKAVYQLTADNPINPYLPNVLSGFRCPSSL